MADNRITLIVEGLSNDDGDVRLHDFLNELQIFSGALNKFDRLVSNGERASYFRIVDMSHESPAAVVVEPWTISGKPDTRSSLVTRFVDAVESINNGDVPEDLDPSLLEELRELAAPVGKKLKAVTIRTADRGLELSQKFAKQIELALSGVEECTNTIEGMLEQINIHGGANVFHIYPRFGPMKVQCHFPKSLLDTAISAVNCEVAISGLAKYKPNASFPHEISVDEIDIYPPENELPTLDDLRGLAPEATDRLPAEDFIGKQRDVW